MDPEGNFELPGVDIKGQAPPPHTQVVEIYYPYISQDPSLIAPETALEVPADSEVPTQVSTPAIEGTHISTRFRSQTDTYAPIMTGKRYFYAMTQL